MEHLTLQNIVQIQRALRKNPPPAIVQNQKVLRKRSPPAIVQIRRALKNHQIKVRRVQVKNHHEVKEEVEYEKNSSQFNFSIKFTFCSK